MANNEINVRHQLAYKTSAEWYNANPVLLNGELAYTSDQGNIFKIGNGTSTWRQLPYVNYAEHPLIHKKYESTSYYATSAGSWEAASWYFMSVKPDSWYKPWKVKFKVHSYCPGYTNVDSYTWATYTGRADSIIYCNWNDRYDGAHYYLPYYPLKKAGFDAGYGHAIGVSILYGSSYTSSAYYRTFEIDYYECENCTVTILDTPVKWASWTGAGTTNYGSLGGPDAYNRGLRETGDDSNYNTIDVLQGTYTIPVAGATAGLKQYSLFAEDANGKYSSFTTQNGTAVTKTVNRTDYFDISKIYYSATSGNFATNGNIGTSVFRWAAALVDLRYTLNIANGTNGLTARKPLYLKFDAASSTIGIEGRPCYKLAGTAVNDWWTQTLSTNYDDHDIIYVKVSEAVYDWYRADLDIQQRFYRFTGNTVINGYDAVVALQSEYARNANYATCVDWACLPATAADRGLNITSNKIGHIKSVTATANISGSASINPGLGGTFAVPYFSIDSYGHTTASGAKTITLPSTSDIAGVTVNNATNATNASKVNNVDFGSASTMASGAFKSSSYAPTRAEILSPIGVGCDYTGNYSVAIHHYTTASKNYSFAAGDSTITPRNYSAVFGSYNASTASSMTIFDIGVGQVNQRVSAFMADIRGGSIVSDLIFASKVSGNKLGEQNCGIPRQPSIRQEYAVVNSWPAFLESDTSHMLTTADDLVTTSMYALGVITPKRHAMGEGAVSPSTYLSKLRGIRDSFNTYSVPFTNTISGTGTVTGSVNITFPFTFYKQPIAIYISIGGSIQLSGESITDDFGGKSACAIVDPQLHIGGSYNVPATGATTASVAYRLRGFDSGNKTVKGNILILFD